jgi:signal transduction histidine kinase
MNKARILIIEDDPQILRKYSEIVGAEGGEVLTAADGIEGWRLCKNEKPDLIILDAALPDIGGISLCGQIKAEADLAGSFVLMIFDENASPDVLAAGLEAGADGYLTEPVEGKVMLAQVRALLRIKRAEQSLVESKEQYRVIAEELRVSNQRLEEYNQLKAEFIANMSHELRTPLTAIIGFAQLIQIRPPKNMAMPPECSTAFERILRNGKHLLTLIDEVLDIAKIEAGRMKIHSEHFDITELTQSAFQELQALAAQKNLDYRLSIPEEVPLALSDPLRVRQVMINLLSNAIKFTQKGTIEVELIPHGSHDCQFIVRDTGIGIEDKSIDVIFERFRQIDGALTRAVGGTGLGLSIVKQIVTLLGGRIDVTSKHGEGSTFTVTLPLGTKTADSGVADVEIGQTIDLEQDMLDADETKPLVLIIEDEEDMANLLSETISRVHYRTIIASSGIEGLRIAREQDLSAILLDIMMPGMDGWRVLQALKAEPQTAQIPVIVCSIVDNRPLGYRLGASSYLIKPVEPEQLITALRNVGTHGTTDEDSYVLVVDDDHGIRELLMSALRKAGFNARSAVSGETALKLVSQSTPRAVLSDLMMPGGMSGYEFIARMRSLPETENVPIIVITEKEITHEDRRFIIDEIANVIRKGDLLMSDLETRLRQTLEEIGVKPTVNG